MEFEVLSSSIVAGNGNGNPKQRPQKSPRESQGYASFEEQAKLNAKCDIGEDEVKMEAEPIVLKRIKNNSLPLDDDETDVESIEYDNTKITNPLLFEQTKELSTKTIEALSVITNLKENNLEERKEEIKERDDDEGGGSNNNQIEFPLYYFKRQDKRLGKMIRVLAYVTICQMANNSILIDEKLTIRKGKGHEYKHQREISISDFFNLILKNKKEVYEKLGPTKALLIEELLIRLYNIGMFREEQYQDAVYIDGQDEPKKITKTKYHTNETSFRKGNGNDFDKIPELGDEIKRIDSLLIKFKEPIVVVNESHNRAYDFLEVKGIKMSILDYRAKGLIFLGEPIDIFKRKEDEEEIEYDEEIRGLTKEDRQLRREELFVNYKTFNFLYKHYEDIIKRVLAKSEYIMKKKVLLREKNLKEVEAKCQRYILAAKIIGVDVNDVLERNGSY